MYYEYLFLIYLITYNIVLILFYYVLLHPSRFWRMSSIKGMGLKQLHFRICTCFTSKSKFFFINSEPNKNNIQQYKNK